MKTQIIHSQFFFHFNLLQKTILPKTKIKIKIAIVRLTKFYKYFLYVKHLYKII